MAAAAGLRVGAAAGDDKQDMPGRGGDSVSVGAAAGAVFVEFHHLFRQPALVCAPAVRRWRSPRRWAASAGRCSKARGLHPTAIKRLFRRAVHLLHGLSWRTLPAQARPAPSDRVLFDDRRGRRAGRTVRGRDRAVDFHRLLRIALGASALRPAVPVCLRQGPASTAISNRWRCPGSAPALSAGLVALGIALWSAGTPAQ